MELRELVGVGLLGIVNGNDAKLRPLESERLFGLGNFLAKLVHLLGEEVIHQTDAAMDLDVLFEIRFDEGLENRLSDLGIWMLKGDFNDIAFLGNVRDEALHNDGRRRARVAPARAKNLCRTYRIGNFARQIVAG